MLLLDDTPYHIFEVEDPPYKIRFYPPMKSNVPKRPTDPPAVTINEKPGHIATALQIDFVAASFLRREKGSVETDPPRVIIKRWVDYLIDRIRFVSNNHTIESVDLSRTVWLLTYLNDDETEVPDDPSLPRKYEQKAGNYALAPLLPEMWDDIHSLPSSFSPPAWKTLLLKSTAALPNIGVALITAATALEVLITSTLDVLATKSSVPSNFWDWLNNRGWLKEPSTDEQFSDLLKLFTNRSLKDQPELWTAYRQLREARNSYAHGGVPLVNKQSITFDQALGLLKGANDIANFVRESLPEELRWPIFKYTTKMRVTVSFADSIA